MYALEIEVEFNAPQDDGAIEFLNQVLIPMVKQSAGFVSGTWMRSRDGARGRSVILYEDEQAADAAVERAKQGPPPGAPARFVSADIYEVIAQA